MKPGAHGFVWAFPRTSHWTATALEDAGFEIRDVVTHLFSEGLPKSLDVAKAIDKARHSRADKARVCGWIADRCAVLKLTTRDLDRVVGTKDMGGWWASRLPHRAFIPTAEHWAKLEPLLGPAPKWMVPLLKPSRQPGDAFFEREVVGVNKRGCGNTTNSLHKAKRGLAAARQEEFEVTAPASEAAREWSGWKTCLKPAAEQYILVRKPLDGTVSDNVLKYRVGGLNIDAARIGTGSDGGRFPTNLVLSHSEGCEPAGTKHVRSGNPGNTLFEGVDTTPHVYGKYRKRSAVGHADDDGTEEVEAWRCDPSCAVATLDEQSGNSSRFYYCAKPSARERNSGGTDNRHPTVKAITLLRYLARLITPPGGVVLDPFMGSGSTGIVAKEGGWGYIGVEQDQSYFFIAEKRIEAAGPHPPGVPAVSNRPQRLDGGAPRLRQPTDTSRPSAGVDEKVARIGTWGGKRVKGQGSGTTLRGRGAAYLLARLDRDRPDLAERVHLPKNDPAHLSANAAAIEAGFRHKTITVPLDMEGAAKALRQRFSGEGRLRVQGSELKFAGRRSR
jgi:hypothetical protein